MKKAILIQQATMADEPLIEKFYKTAFDYPQFKYPHRWDWLHKANPFLHDKRLLPVWLAINRGRVVGMSCLMPQLFSVKGSIVRISWCHDLRVLPLCRGMGIGTKLETARQEAGHVASLASSDPSVGIKKKLGYASKPSHVVHLHVRRFDCGFLFDDLARYLRIGLRSIPYKLAKAVKIDKLFSTTVQMAFRCKQYTTRDRFNETSSLTFKPTPNFPDEVNELWDEIKHRYSLAVVRNSTYLNWKFVLQPHTSYQRYLVYKKKLVGILIFRRGEHPELPIGIISEYYTSQGPDVLRQMLTFAVSRLYDQGCLMIKCSSSTEERSSLLSSIGFFPIRKHLSTLSFSPSNTDAFTEIALKGDWLMGLGDQDCDEFPRAFHPSLRSLIMAFFGRTPGDALIKTFH